MPKTKVYDDRKKVLNEMFRTKKFTMEELIDRVSDRIGDSISKKTIQNDIRAMREEAESKDGSIVCENGKYFYEPKNFNIYDVKVSDDIIDRIKLASSILKQIPGLDIHEDLKELFDKLDMKVKEEFAEETEVIQFDTRPSYTGIKYLTDILEAIKGKRVISFDYQGFSDDKSQRIMMHPYLLKEYNNRWSLIGMTEESRTANKITISRYGLERIMNRIKPEANIKYHYDDSFNPDTYLKNIFGVSLPDNPTIEVIHLKFSAARSKYVETNPFHFSQELLKESKTHKIFTYQLIPNKELDSLILSFGSDVEVLKPISLRLKIMAIIEKNKNLYCK